MTLRPAGVVDMRTFPVRHRKGFSLWHKNGLVSFFLGAVGVRLTLQSADALAVGCIDLLGGSARMDIECPAL